MILWLLSCTQPELKSADFLCDAFVEQAQWKLDEEGLLHVIVDHKSGIKHQISTPMSSTLDILLLAREEKVRGAFHRSHYQYQLVADKGSHIIEPIVVAFSAPEEEQTQTLSEIFVDVGLEETKLALHEALERPQPNPYLPIWLFVALGGGFFWYQRRKRLNHQEPVSLEEEMRSLWYEIRRKEPSREHACKLMSFLLRRYLGTRFEDDHLISMGPQELISWITSSKMRPAAREAALRMVELCTLGQFSDMELKEDTLEVLGRDLEVVMVRLEVS